MTEDQYRELMNSLRDRLQDPAAKQLLIDLVRWKAVTGDAYVMHGILDKLLPDEDSDRPTLQELQGLFDETRTLRQIR